jgi:LysM repeat protein
VKRAPSLTMIIAAGAIITAIVVGAVIGSGGRPRLRAVEGVGDDFPPRVVETPPAATPSPAASPARESPPAATPTAEPQRESAPAAEADPTVTPEPPAESPPAAATLEHTVQPGDLLGQIARRYNTTVPAIVELNPGINPDSLRVGDILRIPAR